jgi:hypothetical protein
MAASAAATRTVGNVGPIKFALEVHVVMAGLQFDADGWGAERSSR